MEKCQRQMRASTERMMNLMLESLETSPEDVQWFKPKTGDTKAQVLFALNSYPVCPEPARAVGLGPHTDTSLLTVLHQSSGYSGLQILREGIGWIPVQPIPGALVVNCGDLMHVLTNGRFKNVLHRAVVNKTRHRISVAYIYGPPRDVKISPLTKLTNHGHPPYYGPITWKEYISLKSKHCNNALEFIKNATE
ncbi:gibberellin 3-beta-dioxygenase 1-like [Abrus precatorius]|uniref:Gibberellin 3-beta-dioxygenase 1-like n=1 Tax=Abrus precatorius TaxID=3816 RepID=A0A8B8JFB7_ABRPR|nr:gibberellin 3-beta-dioxygenase 1-like [Abrus precatorius]